MVGLRFGTAIEFVSPGESYEVPGESLLDIAITGPGRVTSGGGYIGGGFGVAGFAEGVAMASVLNAITSKSEVVTVLQLLGSGWELHGLTSVYEPGALRVLLSPVFTRLRSTAAPEQSQ